MNPAQTPGMPMESMLKVIETLTRQLAEQTELIKKLEAQIAWFQRQMYGARSERRMPIDNVPDLFSIAGVQPSAIAGPH